MYEDENLLHHIQRSLLSYKDIKGVTEKFIPPDYEDISKYIRFDELLQKLAGTSIAYEEKKDQLRKYLKTENIYLWFQDYNSGPLSIPRLSKFLDELLPFNNKQYTPHIKAYLRWSGNLAKLPLKHTLKVSNSKVIMQTHEICETARDNEDIMLKALIDELQGEETVLDFKKANKAFHRTNRNLKRYVSGLIEYKANLLVIRLDLGYNKDYFDRNRASLYENLPASAELIPSEISDDTDKPKEQLTFHEYRLEAEKTQLQSDLQSMKEYRAKFFRAIKNKYAVEGFIWKLEYGADKSFHYHCLILLNGDKHREDIIIAKDMGEIWKKLTIDADSKTTKGIYWNCNANKENYRYLALGHLNASDTTMKNNLFKYVLSYLAKTDYYLKMAKTADRTIGMGSDKVKVKSGRPRKPVLVDHAIT